jgi:hypothetical protein
MKIVNEEGPVEATFKVTVNGKPMTLHCTLSGLSIETDSVYQEYTVDELLDAPFICFSDKLVVKLKETEVLPDETGRYGRLKSNG